MIANSLSSDASAKHRGDVILARYNGTMTERAADVSDHGGRQRKERSPGRRRDFGDEDIAGPHPAELIRAVNHARCAGSKARACGLEIC